GGEAFPCADSTPTDNGFEECSNQVLHRPRIEECEASPARPAGPNDPETTACTGDADCTERPHGYCVYFVPFGFDCAYGCVNDSECGPGFICQCGALHGLAGNCVEATCQSDADCGGSLLCINHGCPSGPSARFSFACQTAEDTCMSNADCGPHGVCTPIEGKFTCQPNACYITG
ncbi:MAG TPA: hypothetical protein VNG33_03210, partial [Polyangiaceae bacterium]|nr:hypothetical protein [Polyangiaceae bacterium]